MANVRAALDKALSQREVIINRLQHCLNDEIEDVRFNIKALKQQSQVSSQVILLFTLEDFTSK